MKVPETFRKLADDARARPNGWTVEPNGGGHLTWAPPDGGPVIVTSSTPGDVREVRNVRARLRRAGVLLGRERRAALDHERARNGGRGAEVRAQWCCRRVGCPRRFEGQRARSEHEEGCPRPAPDPPARSAVETASPVLEDLDRALASARRSVAELLALRDRVAAAPEPAPPEPAPRISPEGREALRRNAAEVLAAAPEPARRKRRRVSPAGLEALRRNAALARAQRARNLEALRNGRTE